MASLRIAGQSPLRGTLEISGRKNAALKLLAATLLTDQPVTLSRVPAIGDVKTILAIMREMGATIEEQGNGIMVISTANVHTPIIPHELGRKLRASVILVGPLLARFGTVQFPHPGGCVIGKRSITPHLEALRKLGAEIQLEEGTYTITAKKLTGSFIFLQEKSVTATENLLMAATRAEGLTTIYDAAEEPHIRNLADLLRNMGYDIRGDGTSRIEITGKPGHTGTSAAMEVIPDDIEVGTFAVAGIVTHGDLTLTRVGTYEQVVPILSKLTEFNAVYTYNEAEQTLRVQDSPNLESATVQVRPWPGFPPDLQSPFTVLATQAHGTSLIHDWMYEGRLYFVDLLSKMGANITVCDPHRALVTGPTPLEHSSLITPDLRAGAAFVIAALAAEGTSVIEHVELIDRGYINLQERLQSVGANITRE